MRTVRAVVLNLLVHSAGRLSTGINLALTQGMTSGKMLDYVYRNQPSGRLLIGQLFDKLYLGNVAWQAVRMRKQHLEECLSQALMQKLGGVRPARILDLASGHARYLQDTMARLRDSRVTALCWDLDERWLREGQAQADSRGLTTMTYEHANVLDPETFRRLTVPPDIVIASGFYDWIPDDEMVRRSMDLVHQSLAEDGVFIFTFQCGHADLQTVNSVFPGFDGRPLTMKVRAAEQVNAWAKGQGFSLLETKVDRWGFYAVSTAKRSSGGGHGGPSSPGI